MHYNSGGVSWRRKCNEPIVEVGVGGIDHSQESFLLLQDECAKLKQERESYRKVVFNVMFVLPFRLLAKIRENEIECEMYTSQLTSVLENSNAQLKQASESVRKMENVVSYLQDVILSKDLEIQLLKRSSEETSPRSSLSVGPPSSSDSNEDETEFLLCASE